MTLDDAIKHAKEQGHIFNTGTCAKEHLQLAEWLEELKSVRRNNCDMRYEICDLKAKVAALELQLAVLKS